MLKSVAFKPSLIIYDVDINDVVSFTLVLFDFGCGIVMCNCGIVMCIVLWSHHSVVHDPCTAFGDKGFSTKYFWCKSFHADQRYEVISKRDYLFPPPHTTFLDLSSIFGITKDTLCKNGAEH
ncbi:hypothetical protein CEXT_774081 [Caerostris extrusa]|uniref:Uncharacterized protein n=1 Tax=Caerostris extrusa TaxID=172846 RepID=A0AAV4NKR0_CAEEX|nr:hypothetical protein CEXT_774081 [Caerostris extrusa]